jgi:hypothetical protein
MVKSLASVAVVLSCVGAVACSSGSSGGAGALTEGTPCTQAQNAAGKVCSGAQTFTCKATADAGSDAFHWDLGADCAASGQVCSQGECVASGGVGAGLVEGTPCTQAQNAAGKVCSGTQTFKCKATADAGATFHWDLGADCATTSQVCSQGACVGADAGP